MFTRLLRDAYDPYEHRYSPSPRFGLGLLDDDYFEPAHILFNVVAPRPQSRPSEGRSDPSQFKVMLNVKQFRPDEIDVKTVDNYIVVHGNHEQRADEHGFITREFTRRYKLPDDVEPDKVTSSLSQDGVLTIQAPRKQIEPPKNERIVPITIQQPAAVEEVQKQQIQDQAAAAADQVPEEHKQ